MRPRSSPANSLSSRGGETRHERGAEIEPTLTMNQFLYNIDIIFLSLDTVVSLSGVALLRYIYAVKTLHTNSTLEYKLPRPCCLLTCMIISRALVFHVITR